MKRENVETDQTEQAQPFLYDVLQFSVICVYLALPLGLNFFLYWVITPYRTSDTWTIKFLALIFSNFPFLFIPYLFKAARRHAHRLIHRFRH